MPYPGDPGYQAYPKHCKDKDGRVHIARNHHDEHRITGVLVDEEGQPITEEPEELFPPTLEFVMSHGFEKEAAEKIVAEEERKHAAGEPPYGTNQPVQAGQETDKTDAAW